jgi:hypothetical protein
MGGMRQLFPKRDLRAVSSILVVVLLLASAPLTVGVVVVSGPVHPELTVDVCHPIQALDLVPGILLARPAMMVRDSVLRYLGAISAETAAQLVELCIAPDTPPPKLPA